VAASRRTISHCCQKRTELGKAQLASAIDVARAFQREAADTYDVSPRRPVTLRYASFSERLAFGSAGKKVAVRYGLHVAEAIEPGAISSHEFREKKLAKLAPLMSDARRRELDLS